MFALQRHTNTHTYKTLKNNPNYGHKFITFNRIYSNTCIELRFNSPNPTSIS